MRTPSIAVMVFLFDTVPIAGTSTRIRFDLFIVNFIYNLLFGRILYPFSFCREAQRNSVAVCFLVFGEDEIKKEGYIMVVIVVVVGGVGSVENSKNVDAVRLFGPFFINIFT